MIIYPDTCIYGRLFDDQFDPDIAADTIDILLVIALCKANKYPIVGSQAVIFEHNKICNLVRRDAIDEQYKRTIDRSVTITANVGARAQVLQTEGVKLMDSYHLAAAEAAGADVLLTVDKDFIKIVAKKNLSAVKVINPLTFLREVYLWAQ
ncbi:MAG: PIN domain-containing protein [Chitinispirillales bacterium]|nr:PIN domain-containing protein [Chitinispirillales bacterium]